MSNRTAANAENQIYILIRTQSGKRNHFFNFRLRIFIYYRNNLAYSGTSDLNDATIGKITVTPSIFTDTE